MFLTGAMIVYIQPQSRVISVSLCKVVERSFYFHFSPRRTCRALFTKKGKKKSSVSLHSLKAQSPSRCKSGLRKLAEVFFIYLLFCFVFVFLTENAIVMFIEYLLSFLLFLQTNKTHCQIIQSNIQTVHQMNKLSS